MSDHGHGKLDWVTSGERRAASAGYTKFVRAMRFILPLAAIALTTIIVLWDEMGAQVGKVDQQKFMPEVEEARGELLNPQFDSTDSEGRPYTVKAHRAVQDQGNPQIMNMEQPDAYIRLGDSEHMSGKSQSGIYEQEAGKLLLNGAVILNHSSGYVLQSDELRVDLKTGQAFSDLPVHVEGEMGTIDASGLEADNNNGLVTFKGPATLILTQAEKGFLKGGNTP